MRAGFGPGRGDPAALCDGPGSPCEPPGGLWLIFNGCFSYWYRWLSQICECLSSKNEGRERGTLWEKLESLTLRAETAEAKAKLGEKIVRNPFGCKGNPGKRAKMMIEPKPGKSANTPPIQKIRVRSPLKRKRMGGMLGGNRTTKNTAVGTLNRKVPTPKPRAKQ